MAIYNVAERERAAAQAKSETVDTTILQSLPTTANALLVMVVVVVVELLA